MRDPSDIPAFDGATFDQQLDLVRLRSQLNDVKLFMVQSGGEWYTLNQLARGLGYPESSISARLRDLRKPKNGGYEIARRRKSGSGPFGGTWEYCLVSKLG